MPLEWFPGHMAKARRELEERLRSVDLVVEVLDARMPLSSQNPLVRELRGKKPFLVVLSKADLADPAITKAWALALGSGDGVAVLTSSSDKLGQTRAEILRHAEAMGKLRPKKPMRLLIAGIPNVGKSTLINALVNRKVAKVSDKPAVTQQQQRVLLPNGMVVTDTPGLMSPKIGDDAVAYRLAFGGAIPATAADYETMALSVAPDLLTHYAGLLMTRFGLESPPHDGAALLQAIGARRGFLRAGGHVDSHKAAEVLVNEFRSGKLGRISLERPGPAAIAPRSP